MDTTALLILPLLFLITAPSAAPLNRAIPAPMPPPLRVRQAFDLDPLYTQWIEVAGLPIVASAKVNRYAVREAAWLIQQLIGHRPDILHALAENRVRFAVLAHNELTTDTPEHSDLKPDYYWDRRARGLGPTPARPATSCGEENLLNYPGDPYSTENILVHEFAHAIHQMGLNSVDPEFEERLKTAYDAAIKNGLWENTYAITNRAEYWAEGTQSWFNTNRANDDQHNHVDTRDKLKDYDPALAALLTDIYGDTPWRYTQAVTRTHLPHLTGFSPADSPTFSWPAELMTLEQFYQELKDPENSGNNRWMALREEDVDLLATLCSEDSTLDTAIIFVNRTDSEVTYHWIDGTGAAHAYGTIAPDDFVNQHTYSGHLWVIKNSTGQVLSVVRATQKTGRALVSNTDLR